MKTISDNIKPILALLIVVLSFTYFFAILIIDKKVDPQVSIAIVALSSAATGYYFGSTTGSSKKDETISKALDQAQTTATPTVANAGSVSIDQTTKP
jgi:hypothetical protein